jgi:outer membrane protein
LQRDNLEKTVKIDVKRAYNNYLAAIKAYNASQVQYQAGELALRTQQESFILGVSSQVTLAQANQTFVLGAASKAQAEVTLMFQKYLLEYAIGTLRFEENP